MSDVKPSAGPWEVLKPKKPLAGFTHAIISPEGCIAWVHPPFDDEAKAEANARLLAAASEMLAALKQVQFAYVDEHLLRSEVGFGDEEVEMAQARAKKMVNDVVAKATGK